MRAPLVCLAVLAGRAIMAAQTSDPDTVTVTVSQPSTLLPDQVSLFVSVTTAVDASLDEVIAMLADARIGAADLTSVSTPITTDGSRTYWYFAINRPIQKLNESVSALAKISARYPGQVGFNIGGGGVSPELAATQPCAYPSLASYARTQAQKIAAAAGLSVGPVVAVSDTPPSSDSVQAVALIRFSGYFYSASDFGGRLYDPASVPITCSMTVQFKLLH